MQNGDGRKPINAAVTLFEDALDWLHESYFTHRFFVERDLVWTLQRWLQNQITEKQLPLRVFNDYPILPGNRRSLCADLAIVDTAHRILVAAEFKYEPAHNREDILPQKFPVVFWDNGGVGDDVRRIKTFIAQHKTDVAYAIFIDEGGAFKHRPPLSSCEWQDWGGGAWVLLSKIVQGQ